MEFTEFIKKRREVLGLTQEDLARRLGTTTAYVGLIELGQRRPKKVTSLEKLRTALEIAEQDSGWFFRFITYGEKSEFCDTYLTTRVIYQEPDSGSTVITEDSPVYQAFSDVVNHPSIDQEQLLQVLKLLQNPEHPLSQIIALLLDKPSEVIATLLQRIQFELQLTKYTPKKDS
jgi:transcriptional regulator with XRE-family HTH domain